MLVDDNEIVRKGLQEALEHSDDFTVVGQTGEGEEALGLAERLLPDVILMDVLMPGKNGIDACREITTALPDAKVLMLTAFSDRDAMDDALAAGATGYLPKLWGREPTLEHPARRGGRALPLSHLGAVTKGAGQWMQTKRNGRTPCKKSVSGK